MIFPSVNRIATKNVITISAKSSLNDAIEAMHKNGHRDIIVTAGKKYYLLTINDIIRFRIENISFEEKMEKLPLMLVPQIHEEANILDAFKIIKNDIEYLCLVDELQELRGIVTYTDIVSSIDPEILMENSCLGDMFKDSQVYVTNQEEIMLNVLGRMLESGYDYVVVAEDKMPVGIVTTKDAIKLIANEQCFKEPIKNHMTSPVKSLDVNVSVKDALSFIQNMGFKHVVVTEPSGELVGVLTQKDLIGATYLRWAEFMKHHHEELREINQLLERKTVELEKMAATDSLTKLYNRHVLTTIFEKEKAKAKRNKIPLSFVMLDIDHFKKINDTLGHLTGDSVLIKLAKILTAHVRAADTIGRWGGEEFIIILPETDLEGAAILAEKLRKTIELSDFENAKSITASFGVAQCQEEDTMEILIEKADKALYVAKENGRNRVCKETK